MPKESVVKPIKVPSRFPVMGKPDVNLLEQFIKDPQAPFNAPLSKKVK